MKNTIIGFSAFFVLFCFGCSACGISVPQQGLSPGPPKWKHHLLTTNLCHAKATPAQSWAHTNCPLRLLWPQHYSTLGARTQCCKEVEHTVGRSRDSSERTPRGFCSSTLVPDSTPSMVVLTTEQRRSLGSHLPLAVVPSCQSPAWPPSKVIAASTPWWKNWLVLTSQPALPPKPLGSHTVYLVNYFIFVSLVFSRAFICTFVWNKFLSLSLLNFLCLYKIWGNICLS